MGALAAITDERKQLSARLELILREAEEDKARHEQERERAQAANARVLEERDRIAQEVQQLSRLYEAAVQQLRAGGGPDSQTNMDAAGVEAETADADSTLVEDLAKIKAQLEEMDERIRRVEEQNAGLRGRVQKLALDP